VAFTSLASNLTTTPAVTSGTSQVYWTPSCTTAVLITGSGCASTSSTTLGPTLVSVSADGLSAGNGNSYDPVISSDGQFVAFVSLATNLVTSNSLIDGITPQVFVRTVCNPTTAAGVTTTSCTPTTYLVSSADGVTPGNGASSQPSIANAGAFVSFTSFARNLGPSAPDPVGKQEIFEQSECYGVTSCVQTTNLISTPDAGATPADGASMESSISDDGRFIAFASTATNLIPGIGPLQQIYLYDTCGGTTAQSITCAPSVKLVSTPNGVLAANALAENPSINQCGGTGTCATGQFVAFATKASNLGSTVAAGIENVYVRNTCSTTAGTTTPCTPATAVASQQAGTTPTPSNGDSLVPSISGDGHSVAFISYSTNLVPRDTNNLEDIFLGLTSF
jgi:WD40-like Beta Propeller Repeat